MVTSTPIFLPFWEDAALWFSSQPSCLCRGPRRKKLLHIPVTSPRAQSTCLCGGTPSALCIRQGRARGEVCSSLCLSNTVTCALLAECEELGRAPTPTCCSLYSHPPVCVSLSSFWISRQALRGDVTHGEWSWDSDSGWLQSPHSALPPAPALWRAKQEAGTGSAVCGAGCLLCLCG